MQTVDLLIIGDGIVARTASLCAQVLGLEAVRVSKLEPEYENDPRRYAIAPSSEAFLKAIGIAPIMDKVSSIEIGFGEVLGGELLTFSKPSKPMMSMIGHGALSTALTHKLQPKTHLTKDAGEIVLGEFFVELPEHNLRAPLLIIADGKNSKHAKTLGISYQIESYDQLAITNNFKAERPHNGVARQLFSQTGPLGILPHGIDEFSIVWSQNRNVAEALLDINDNDFTAHLQAKLGTYYGKVTQSNQRASFPLAHMSPSRLGRDRFVLAGDCAHAIHPLAGQGLNLGLRDVACLFEVIIDSQRLGLDVGSSVNINRYVSWRKSDIARLTSLTKTVQKFGAKAAVLTPVIKKFTAQITEISDAKLTPQPKFLDGFLP